MSCTISENALETSWNLIEMSSYACYLSRHIQAELQKEKQISRLAKHSQMSGFSLPRFPCTQTCQMLEWSRNQLRSWQTVTTVPAIILFQALCINSTKLIGVEFVPAVLCGENETELQFVTTRFPGFQIVSAHLQVPQAGNRLLTPPWPNDAGNIGKTVTYLHFCMAWNQMLDHWAFY